MGLVSLAWVGGEAALTILHRWKVVLLLPPWLPINRVMEILRAIIKAKGSTHLERHPGPFLPSPNHSHPASLPGYLCEPCC